MIKPETTKIWTFEAFQFIFFSPGVYSHNGGCHCRILEVLTLGLRRWWGMQWCCATLCCRISTLSSIMHTLTDTPSSGRSFMSTLSPAQLHRVRKKRPPSSGHNFDKFRHSFVIFGTNHPDISAY